MNWFHLACSDVTTELDPHLERIEGCLWVCESCLQLVEYDLQQPGGTKPNIDSIKDCVDSTVEASIKPLHNKIAQLSKIMSECKEEIAKHQIQVQEKIIHIPRFQIEDDTSLQIKIDNILEADKDQKQTLNYEEEKVSSIMEFLSENPTVIGIDVLESLILSRSDHDQ